MSKQTTLCMSLLRVVAVDSGATPAERETAARRIGELVAKYDLIIIEKGDTAPPAFDADDVPSHAQAEEWGFVTYSTPRKVRPPSYHPSIAAMPSFCRECGNKVMMGTRVMRRMLYGVIEYMHSDCWRPDARR